MDQTELTATVVATVARDGNRVSRAPGVGVTRQVAVRDYPNAHASSTSPGIPVSRSRKVESACARPRQTARDEGGPPVTGPVDPGNLPKSVLHEARHTTLSLLAKSGVPVAILSAWAGHHDARFTMTNYVHVDDEDLSVGTAKIRQLYRNRKAV
jgi:hypothetical protein